MARKRKTDPKALTWYRTDRMIEDNGKWFFHTRELTIEGPFHSQADALTQLEIYINVQNSGILDNDNNYALKRVGLRKTG